MRKGADEFVGANTAEGVCGDGGGGAVVEDEGGAGGVGFGKSRSAADAGGEVCGVNGGVWADFDDGGRIGREGVVARGGLGEEAGVAGRARGEGELELRGRGGVCWGGWDGCDHHLAPFESW